MRSFNSKETFFWLLLLPKDKNGLVFLSGSCPPAAQVSGATAAKPLAPRDLKQKPPTTFGTLGSQAKPSPSTTSPPRQELLFKHHKYTSCSGLEQSPQPTVRTQELYELPHCETLIPHTDVPGDPAPSGARCAEHHVEQSGKALKKVAIKPKR